VKGLAETLRKIEVKDDYILRIVEDAIRKYGYRKENLIAILQELQGSLGYLPMKGMETVAEKLRIPLAQVYGVATFFHQFRLSPRGKHMILMCMGTACHLKGANQNYEALRNFLKLEGDEDTTGDGEFTLIRVRCMGACSLAPVMRVDDVIYGRVTVSEIFRIINALRKERQEKEKEKSEE
jgi:NADH:ubiquinone oxidoreductase subunit E